MQHPDTISNLEPYFANEEVLAQTIEQLNKDAYPHMEFKWKTMSIDKYEDIVSQLAVGLEAMGRDQYEQLLSFLYRVDLPQIEHNSLTNSDERYLTLAKMVLNRELKKVLFRLFYKIKS